MKTLILKRLVGVTGLLVIAFMIGCSGESQIPKDFLEEVKFADIKMAGPFTTHDNAVLLGSTGDVTIFITNEGDKTAKDISTNGLVLVEPYAFKGGKFPGEGGTCGTVLEPGSKCTIVLTFTPTSEDIQPLTLNITYHDGRSVRSIFGKVEARGARGAPGSLDETFLSTGFVRHAVE